MLRLRLRLCRFLCPSSHRLIEVGDVVTDPSMLRGDLIRGGDALARGWNCDPAILWNAAVYLEEEVGVRERMAYNAGYVDGDTGCPHRVTGQIGVSTGDEA